MNIVITGSTGFVGKRLTPALLEMGYNVLELTRGLSKSKELYGNSTKKIDLATINYKEFNNNIISFSPDICIHLAAYLSPNDDFDTMQLLLNSNVIFIYYLLNVLKDSGIKVFINTGTFAEYYKGNGNLEPAYLYAATKTASRAFVDYYSKVYNFKNIIIVPYTIYGDTLDSKKKVLDYLYDSLGSPDPIDFTPGDQILDFVFIEDLVNFYIKVVEYIDKLPPSECFQVGTGIGYTLKEISQIMEKITGKKANINWGGKPYRPRDVMYAVANISKQYHLFGWRPKYSIYEGIEKYVSNRLENR
ncbi:MAG: NAD(P)-dependent oxidoreductase [Candidatus Cloacimonas sp.]|jgi:nucleoside-diphosphate-sugar epimerase|nr:NAD(P)-dependent oxidoreductase [Candidatus Cloacimonas sp.]